MGTPRDPRARIKLVGATLRLGQFTSKQLAEFAGVKHETARSFLRPDKGLELTEIVSSEGETEPLRAESTRPQISAVREKGRPAVRYQLKPEKRDVAFDLIAKDRQQIEAERKPQEIRLDTTEESEDFSPAALLGSVLEDLKDDSITDAERVSEKIKQAEIYARGLEVELAKKPSQAATALLENYRSFEARRLEARSRSNPEGGRFINAFVPPRSPTFPDIIGAEVSPPRNCADLLRNFFDSKKCKWPKIHGTDIFDRVVLLIDGIKGADSLSKSLSSAFGALKVALVSIDLTTMDHVERYRLYSVLDTLRSATPWAAADVMMTIDSSSSYNSDFVSEIRDLGTLGVWRAKAEKHNVELLTTTELDRLRKYYVSQGMEFVSSQPVAEAHEDMSRKIFASRCTTVLAAQAGLAGGGRISSYGTMHRADDPYEKLRYGTAKLMGQIACIDNAFSPKVEEKLSNEPVIYISSNSTSHPNLMDDDFLRTVAACI